MSPGRRPRLGVGSERRGRRASTTADRSRAEARHSRISTLEASRDRRGRSRRTPLGDPALELRTRRAPCRITSLRNPGGRPDTVSMGTVLVREACKGNKRPLWNEMRGLPHAAATAGTSEDWSRGTSSAGVLLTPSMRLAIPAATCIENVYVFFCGSTHVADHMSSPASCPRTLRTLSIQSDAQKFNPGTPLFSSGLRASCQDGQFNAHLSPVPRMDLEMKSTNSQISSSCVPNTFDLTSFASYSRKRAVTSEATAFVE